MGHGSAGAMAWRSAPWALLCAACLPPGDPPSGDDVDGDGYYANAGLGYDCNDDDDGVNPGVTEVCDGNLVDNDCDGVPDGDVLPWVDYFSDGYDHQWVRVSGEEPDQAADGLRVGAPPLVLARHPGAECMGGTTQQAGYRLSVGWVPADSEGSFELELVVLTGAGWAIGQERPDDGYLLHWDRQSINDSAFSLSRLSGGEETQLGYASWQPVAEEYTASPYLFVEVRVDDEATHLSVHAHGVGHNAVMAREDSSEDRHTVGGIGVGVVGGEPGGVLTGVYLDPL